MPKNHVDPKPELQIGDSVAKCEESWVANEFDNWGRGVGIGIIVEAPFTLDPTEVDVKWPNGRCFEYTHQLRKVKQDTL